MKGEKLELKKRVFYLIQDNKEALHLNDTTVNMWYNNIWFEFDGVRYALYLQRRVRGPVPMQVQYIDIHFSHVYNTSGKWWDKVEFNPLKKAELISLIERLENIKNEK